MKKVMAVQRELQDFVVEHTNKLASALPEIGGWAKLTRGNLLTSSQQQL
jgi:hypothetical protein